MPPSAGRYIVVAEVEPNYGSQVASHEPSHVAVIVRTKDRPLFLRRALRDIFDQTHSDFSVVVVNDGGDADEVDGVVAELPLEVRERVNILHREQSTGMEAASNAGIRSCDSAYIAIHDDDDLWHPEFLQRTVRHLENSFDAGVVVRTNVRFEEVVGDDIVETRSEPCWPAFNRISLGEQLRINRAVPISFLYRRSLHEEVGYYNENLAVCGDWEFNLRVLAMHPIGFLDGEPLAFWCQRPTASGAEANSIFEKAEEHRHFDRMVRDNFLRDDLAKGGLGFMLQLSSLMAQQEELLLENQRRMDRMQEELTQALRRVEDTVKHRTSLSSVFSRGKAAVSVVRDALQFRRES